MHIHVIHIPRAITSVQSWFHLSSSFHHLSLSFNSQRTGPQPVWTPCKLRSWRCRPSPHHATFGPLPCSDPPGRWPGPRKTRTTLSGHCRTGTGTIRGSESSWCSWCVWAGSSWREACGLVSARILPAGRHPEPGRPSLCRCLRGGVKIKMKNGK